MGLTVAYQKKGSSYRQMGANDQEISEQDGVSFMANRNRCEEIVCCSTGTLYCQSVSVSDSEGL